MTTTARVQVTIDVQASSSWSDQTTVKQIRDQAVAGVMGMLSQIEQKYDLKVIGEPRVQSTTTDAL